MRLRLGSKYRGLLEAISNLDSSFDNKAYSGTPSGIRTSIIDPSPNAEGIDAGVFRLGISEPPHPPQETLSPPSIPRPAASDEHLTSLAT